MKVDGGLGGALDTVATEARALEDAGYSGAWTAETNHDPFLPLLLGAEHTSELELGTSLAVAFARIECWYFMNSGFFPEENWILNNIQRIRKIPCWIAQGRFDVVTPIASAWAVHRAWPEAKLDIVPDAGHASSEPGIVDSLIRATDWAASL